MTARALRVAFVGAGQMARHHLRIVQHLPVPAVVIVSEKTPFDAPADAQWWKDAHAQFARRAPNRRLVNAAGRGTAVTGFENATLF